MSLLSTNIDPANLPKLKPEYKVRWLEALRSGRYPQGTDMLRTSYDEYCCLGVLCDVVKKDLNLEWFNDDEAGWFIDHADTDIPRSVGELVFEEWHTKLADEALAALIFRNDGSSEHKLSRHDFNQIADLVEEYM